ncbi:LPXTG cell wall anchor domain-containing protein [Enterococcus faecium]|uniref:LPXTG cell wall anchor domain-containing protein n=1 Tax=Enterococcus faecium TaxID=1352 RepID=UPI000CF60200|nr:LPXTG cell wall anchor domain-containing protein [Enterococcus faecium]EGP5128604.1 LPXTG cell wall anchor domain-containing protein [Enterococcus faecium]EME8073321.1 LPXTG cell wall anchor domain-containing protein [Enterococcus faecium]MCD5203485.1 LPXTG cell wall anchor domain-containing protein [Enterococcus faecium]MCD5213950.1 LPXTG cell wall anchor domain-containing protein [Enterococcus faecium]MCD5224029.1 LPXTG cell wall anchor domain-containing protein [Enterococcus faecium]
MRYSTILISTFAALSLSLTINQTVHTEEIETAKWTETKWANVNRITFQDEFSSFNSGVAKLRKGQTATIKAKIDYSGDLAPILQSAVTFENVDPALSIGYDENTLTIQHKQAIFTFTVTLNQDLLKPALFTVKVSDGLPNDHHHLTPYSQRQTIEQDSAIDSGGDLVEEPTDKPENENKPEVPPTENPDGEQKPEIEPGEEPDTETQPEPDNESKPEITPGEKPDVDPEEKPDVDPEEKPDVDPEEKPDVTPEPDTDSGNQTVPETNPDTDNETENPEKPEVAPEEKPDVTPEPDTDSGNQTVPETIPDTDNETENPEKPEVDPEEKPDVTPEPDTDARDQGIPEKINKKTIQEDGKKESKKSNLAILKINEEQLNKKSRIFDSAQSAETLKSSKDTTFASPETKNKQLPKSGESQNKVILWSGIILLSIATMLSAKRFKQNRSL